MRLALRQKVIVYAETEQWGLNLIFVKQLYSSLEERLLCQVFLQRKKVLCVI